jgi:spermidine/putrescine transport system permease protein
MAVAGELTRSGAGAGAAERARPRGTPWQRFRRGVARWALPLYALFAVLYLALPVLVMILFSFNDPPGRANLTWAGFSLDAWLDPLGRPGLPEAVFNSIAIAFLSTVISTALGVLMALALVRHSFRGRGFTNLLIFLPMSTPEIVLGTSLLTLFLASAQWTFIPKGSLYPLGFQTILIAHVMFNISYVVVTVRARLLDFPRHLEEAARDLYADEWTTFWRVTFPLILPGVIAAALLAFSLSIDDYVVTAFTSGQAETFPLYIYGSQQRGIPVQVNVIGTIIFVSAVGFVLLTTILSRRQRPDPVEAADVEAQP